MHVCMIPYSRMHTPARTCACLQVQLEPLIKSQQSKYTGIGQALVTIFKEEGVQVSSWD